MFILAQAMFASFFKQKTSRGAVLTTGFLAVGLCFLSFVSAGAAPASRVLTLLPEGAGQSLTGHFDALRDETRQLTFFDVAFGDAAHRFTAVEKNIAFGYTRDAAWLKISVHHDPVDPMQGLYTLLLLPSYLDEIEIFIPRISDPTGPADFAKVQRGDHFLSEPQSGQGLYYTVPLDLRSISDATIYIRIVSSSSLAARGWIANPNGLQHLLINRASAVTLLITLTFGSSLLSLVYWLYLRRSYFLTIAFLLASDGFYVLSTSGIALSLLRHLPADVADMMVGQSVILLIFANTIFARNQIEVRGYFPAFGRIARLVGVLTVTGAIATTLGFYRYVAPPLMMMGMGVLVLFLYGSARLPPIHRKPGWTATIMVGAIKLISVAVSVAWIIGGTETTGFLEYSYWVSVALFSPLMILALVQRARFLDRRRRDRDSLRIARRAEQAARALVKTRTAELLEARDIAEAALAAERDAQTEQLRFVDVVRHQYQTPLAVIRTSVAAIEKTLPTPDEINHERLTRIKAAIGALRQILDVSLHRSRLQGASVVAHRVTVSVYDMLDQIVGRAQDFHDTRTIILDRQGLNESTTASVDPDMVAIALENLIDNAVKFSAETAPISIHCRAESGRLVITVRDQGIGIPENEQTDIGKRYFRASNAGPISGTGLGLNIVKAIATAHNGRFRITSKTGTGTEAILTLAG
jgi:two-component system, sensor histidine kinase LadS